MEQLAPLECGSPRAQGTTMTTLGSRTQGLAGMGQRQHGASTIPSCRITPVQGILDSSRTLPNLRFN